MDLAVFLVVLASAVMQAGWNVVVKIRLHPLQALVLIVIGGGVAALPVALWLGPPPPNLWPWIGASILAHMSYYAFLVGAYARAGMSVVYTVARGSALLMTAAVAIVILREPVGPVGIAGIGLLAASVLLMARHAHGRAFEARALGMAIGSGISVAAYTLIDGTAARQAGAVSTYTAWLFVCDAVVVAAITLAVKRRRALSLPPAALTLGLLGGLMLFVSYWLSVWAMTRAPIALVTAVRESSVLFGAIMAVVILREPLRADRVAAAFLVVAGLALIKLH